MQNLATAHVETAGNGFQAGLEKLPDAPKVVVCVDDAAASAKVIPRASAVASSLGAKMMLLHVIEPHETGTIPFDPVEWDIKRRKAELHVARLAGEHGSDESAIETRVLEGKFGEQICACVSGRPQDITALCRRDSETQWHAGGTLHHILQSGPGSILLVPDSLPQSNDISFSRIFVPLDGSARAESSLPVATRIAIAQGADLVLVHATPKPSFTETGPLEADDIALLKRVQSRNEKVANEYLERIRARIATNGLTVTTLILKGGDVRRLLIDAIGADSSSLLVMSSHGVGGFGDVPSGDVASFILDRCGAAMLMIKRPRERDGNHVYSEAETRGVRHPAGGNG
jgi:nucleotide-binding universal stress UspA family protein